MVLHSDAEITQTVHNANNITRSERKDLENSDNWLRKLKN